MTVIIDPEFQALIPPLTDSEREQLEKNILADGCRDPLVVWQGILLDGHNRHRICTTHGIKFGIKSIVLANRVAAMDWIDANQLGRRNLKPDQMSALRGRRYNRAKKAQGGRTDRYLSGGQNVHPKTAEKLAAEHGVTEKTIRRDGKFAEAIETVKPVVPDIAKKIISGQGPAKVAVVIAAKILEDYPDEAKAVLTGKATVKQVQKDIKKKEKAKAKAAIPADLPAVTKRYRVFRCNLAASDGIVPDASVDWIITDPPYERKALDLNLFIDLREFAYRTLKPGGSLICMIGQSYLPDVFRDLCGGGLQYQWTLAYLTPGGQAVQLWERKVNTFWKPLLWFVKGKYAGDWIGDVCKSDVNDNDKEHHKWGQSESGMADVIERFTYPGQTICDPCCGAGTTGVVAVQMNRMFIGLDKDADAVDTTVARLSEVARA